MIDSGTSHVGAFFVGSWELQQMLAKVSQGMPCWVHLGELDRDVVSIGQWCPWVCCTKFIFSGQLNLE